MLALATLLSYVSVINYLDNTVSFLQKKQLFTNPRWWVFSRVLAALIGGYALATTFSLLLTPLLGTAVGHYQAMHIGLMLSFLVYAGAAMWVFSVKTATSAWLSLFKLNVIFLAVMWALIQVSN